MRHKISLGIIFFISFFAFSACQKQMDTVEELEAYVSEKSKDYTKTIEKNGVKLTLQYLPLETMMLRHYKDFEKEKSVILADTALSSAIKNEQLSRKKEELVTQKESYNKSIYFKLSILYTDEKTDLVYNKLNSGGFGEYSIWLQKLLFSLGEYIYLETEDKMEVPLSLYHMERNYGLTKESNFLLVFPKEFNGEKLLPNENSSIKIYINEFGLRTGGIDFDFSISAVDAKFKITKNNGKDKI